MRKGSIWPLAFTYTLHIAFIHVINILIFAGCPLILGVFNNNSWWFTAQNCHVRGIGVQDVLIEMLWIPSSSVTSENQKVNASRRYSPWRLSALSVVLLYDC
jgi:hypothetical protein